MAGTRSGAARLLFFGVAAIPSQDGKAQTTLYVPANFPTIQAAINAAATGDTVLVASGTYVENIDFLGKGITVRSEAGPPATILDGNNQPLRVVKFVSGEPNTAILSGFTIRNSATGGILVDNGSSPTIVGNEVRENHGCLDGIGIEVHASSPRILGNRIENNTVLGCSGGEGGGIYLWGSCSGAEILDNRIVGNFHYSGGGIGLGSAGSPLIRGNFVGGNLAAASSGGIGWYNSAPRLIQNVFFGNTANAVGGAIALSSPSINPPGQIVNNTVIGNNAVNGSALYTPGLNFPIVVANNVFIGPAGTIAVHSPSYTAASTFRNNDVFCPGGTPYGGGMPDLTGTNGNFSADPLFATPSLGDFHLLPSSPCVDAGFAAVPAPPLADPDGDARVYDGNGDGTAAVDIGWDEYAPASRFGAGCAGALGLAPRVGLSGPPPAVGNPSAAILLSNAPAGTVSILTFALATPPAPISLAPLGLSSCALSVSPLLLIASATVGAGIGGGALALPVPIPNDPSLHGLHSFFQAYSADWASSLLPGALSTALDVAIP